MKVIQALLADMPFVSTSMGDEGTRFKYSIYLLIANTAEEFTACVRRWLTEAAPTQSLVRDAQTFRAGKYDMTISMGRILSDALARTTKSHVAIFWMNMSGWGGMDEKAVLANRLATKVRNET